MRNNQQQFVFVVDDDQAMRESISDYLSRANYHVRCYESGAEMLSNLDNFNVGVIICDLRMPHMNGMEVLIEVNSTNAAPPMIMITAHGNIPTAVEAMHNSAYDFIEKPFEPEDLRQMIDRAMEKHQFDLENEHRKSHADEALALDQILLGQSKVMGKFRHQLIEYANVMTNILLIGEQGVEKGVVAKVIHQYSPQSEEPFIHVNCKIASQPLFEKTFLGVEGAFSKVGEGIIFLDSVDCLPVECRAQLLTLLEKKIFQYDYRPKTNTSIPRLICSVATIPNDVKMSTALGKIYSRLGKLMLFVPTLRERADDIVELFNLYQTQAAVQYQTSIPALSAEDALTLSSYEWPGNQHQLKQIAERFVLLNRTKRVSISHLLEVSPTEMVDMTNRSNKNLRTLMHDFEHQLITQAMIECSGNINQVCNLLKIPRRTLNEKLLKHELSRTDFL